MTQKAIAAPLINFTAAFLLVMMIGYLFVVGSSFFIPFLLAMVVWYLMTTMAAMLEQLPYIGKKIPHWLAMAGGVAIIMVLLRILLRIITLNISQLITKAPLYQEKLRRLSDTTFAYFGKTPPRDLSSLFQELDFTSWLSAIASSITDLVANTGIILIYVVFLLLEQHLFRTKISHLISDPSQQKKTFAIIDHVTKQIHKYLGIKTLLSVVTAALVYVILRLFEVDFAAFWALVTFFFNYIPTIGSIVATILPCLLSLIQHESVGLTLSLTLLLFAVHFLIGNITEPRMMGHSFNLSGLVIILLLTLFGKIWGVVGMLLCVPAMVIATIILSNFPATKPLAILLSATGELER